MRRLDLNAQRAKTLYSAILAALTVVVGALFLFVLADLYTAGNDPMYSYAEVGARMRFLIIPLCLWIVAVVAGAILCSAPNRAVRGKISALDAYKRLRRNLPAGEGEEFLAERQKIRMHDCVVLAVRCTSAAFCVLSAVMCAVYLFRIGNFDYADVGINAVVISAMKWTMPWIGSSLILCVGAVIFEHFFAEFALTHAKRAMVIGKGYPKEQPAAFLHGWGRFSDAICSKWSVFGIRIAIATVAVIFIVLGVLNGGARDVLYKAVMICTECIGLG